MSRYFRSEPVFCLWRVSLAAFCLSFTLGLARGATLVQDFYLPMPEAQISQANNTIVSGSAGAVNSTFSILVTGDNTVIYYDQWEDGYETDLSNPTQSTTQIWGDGNDAHGIPPGFAHNPLGLPAGTVITLTNSVSLPRNPSQILWDARDHIAATKALVITRAAWPTSIGPVFAGAVGVLSTLDYGTNYISPVGQNMTNGLFKYVGLYVMAAQNNTAVLIDPNGNGVGTTNIVLNQGESYLVNGGIMTGGRVTATKPVQADLVIGDTKNDYASDWFTLYPVAEWSSSYYTPVSSAATQNQPAYVYLFNPNTNSIIINYSTLSGSGSFSVPATNGVFQFQMPVASGASFSNSLGENFFAICTVAANPQNDTAYNWGFTLVPKAALTTQADVGWGPGSAQTNVDGSPVWVTTVSPTTVYVCYNGGTNGLLVDPDGNNYDTNFTLTTLQSQKIYAPSKTQTGMKLYTLNGALIAAAWGEDADVASPGNPYIDAGTTVIPFPVPTLIKTAVIVTDTPPAGLSLGDTIQYSVTINNSGLLPLGNTLVIDAPTTNLLYLTNSTTYNGTPIPDSTGSQPFPLSSPGYTVPVILSQGTSTFTYLAKVVAPGAVSNSVNIGGTAIFSQAYLPPAITNGASIQINFTDTNRVPVILYTAGAGIYVTVTNTANDATSTNITVSVQDTTHGDVENIVLSETGTNTGVFRNITALPSSATAGLSTQDGILNVTPGDTLSVSYTDPIYGDSASNTAAIQIPALLKQLYLSFTNGPQNLDRIDPVAYLHSPVRTSVDLSLPPLPGVDSVTTFSNTTPQTNIFSHTTAGVNRLMLVGISINRGTGGTTFETPTNVTYAGMPLVYVGGRTNLASQEAVVFMFALVNPPVGTANVVVNWNMTQVDGDVIGCATFTNVNQTTPYGPFFSNTNTSTAVSLVVASAPGELVFDTVMLRSANFGAGSPGPNQTALWKTFFNAKVGAGASTQPGAALVTNTWTAASAVDCTIGAVSIRPVSIPGGTNSTVFTQTPVFCSSFMMPSNNLVTITNYITVTNGVMPANPAVTATLQYNGINFLTLTNPTYSSTASNLIWSTLLSSNVTVPPGQAITYVITNNQAGTAFHINYDSTNAQSKITLPTSTAIQIETFSVYDGPYPGGNLVITPTAGSTLYVRATVTDPFGTYDITGLGVAITAPVPSANLNTNLSAANIVADDGTNRTYEVAWKTGPTTGNFSIVATANEGTEGITATATASVSPITLDLGTPNTTEFTSGNDGVATNAYPGVASGSVCILVQDLGAITNPVVIQMVTATVISSAGDSELLTLTETATNTGIFTGCINTSTNGPDIPNDGLLYAPAGSLLTASYTNSTYPAENSSAIASILPSSGTPGVKIIKTIASPSGGDVGVGQPVVFNLKVINSGSTVLGSVTVTDNFPSSALSYSSASLTPSATTANSLTWTNLGGLIPGQSTNLTVTFNALVTGLATNFATANGGTATNTSSASILVTHTALSITKLVLSPTNSPVSVGSNIVFRLLIQNVGNTVIPTLPLEDNFSGAYFSFVTSTIPPNGSGYGSLIWTNLASPTALATNATITNDITMTVVGQGNPANNTAVADYAVDAFGNSVPTATGSTNVITAAATISGYVYNDKDQSGTLTAGDTPLSGVTIQIYTDPTGTGTPGTLVQETTTSSGGYYELDNLALGHYVVAETDLPGFANTVPSNGRLPFNLTTLTTSVNNYFFQYQPNTSAYSTYSGRVINDLLGTGSNTNQSGVVNVTVNLVQDLNSNGIADPGEPVIYSDSTGTNGNYSFSGVVPGHYVIQEVDLYGYYSTGDSQPPNDNQISFITTTNGVTSTTNFFYERLSPVAVNDTNSGFYLVPAIISPLTNDLSPNGDPLTISNAFTTNGILVINPGSTNLTLTPTNSGVDTIIYTNADAHGGTSTAVITVNVTALADLSVAKSASATVPATSNLIYTISVTNLGPSLASSVTVTDAVPVGASFVGASTGGVNNSGVIVWTLGNLANGTISNVTLTVAAPTSGTLTNVATVGSPTGDPVLTNNTTPPVISTVTSQADLQIGKTAAGSVLATSNLVYTISVTNFGPSVASSVTVTDTVPFGASFAGASAGSVNNSGVIVWSLGNLASGAASNVTLTVSAPSNGTLTNVAAVGSPTGDPVLTNNITPPVLTTVIPQADLQIGKSAAASVLATSNLVYTISVTNFGPSVASGVTVTDTVPVGASFVGASAGSVNNSGVIVWSLGDLASGAVSNVTLTVAAPTTGILTNVAMVGSPTGDPVLTNNVTPPVTTTVIPQADLQVGKTAAASVLATSNLVYIISVTNFGPSVANGVTVTDTVPVGASFAGASAGSVNTGGVIVWSLGDLASGAVSNVTLTVAAPTSGILINVATAGSPTGDPVLTNNITPPVITTVIPQADVQIGKSAAPSVLATSNLVYTISVTNFGPSTASSVTVTDTVPFGTSFAGASAGSVNNGGIIVWTLGNLASGAISNVTLTVAAPTTGTLTNVATTGSPTGDPVLTNNITPPVITTVIPQADLQIGKSATGSVLATSNLVYTISVTNFGPSAANSVTVTDSVPFGASFVSASIGSVDNAGVIVWSLGDLASGAISNVTLTVAAPTSGILINVASAGSPTGDPVLTNNITPPVLTVVIPQADLQIGKAAAASVLATSNLVYTISVTNFGPSVANSVTVTDTVPVGTSFVGASAGSVNNGGVIVWSLGNLASGTISNVTLTVTAPTTGTLTNVATVGSPTGDPVLTNNITPPVLTTVIPQADLQIGKAAAASVLATSNLVYTISVTNVGPSAASSVTVTDTVPVGASFVSASSGSVDNSGVIVWSLGNLASGAVSNVTLTVTAPTSGTLTNVATVGSPTDDPVLTNNMTPPVITTVIPQADLQIGKTAAASVLATSNLLYTISVTNFGPSMASSVTVTDSVPFGASFVSASTGSVNNGGVIIWTLGDMANGAISNVTLTVAAPTTGTLTNVATVGSPTGDLVLTNNITPPVTTMVIPQADLQVGKTAAALILATSNLVYTISVTNFGPSTASSVTVTDTVPVGAGFVSASAGNVNSGGVIVWSLGDLASGAISSVTLTVAAPTSGMLINVATAGSPTGDPVLTNNVTPPVITTVVPQADLQIGKTAAASVLATSNLLYTISVTNFGPSMASSVTVTDTVPVGASFVGASAGSVDNSGNIVWSLGNLASGAVSNVTLTVVAPTTGTLTNVATVGSPTGDPVLTNNITPPVITTVIPQADLQIGKTAAASVLATSNLLYTISVTNFGPSVANSVTVTDTVPFGASFVNASAGSVNSGGVIVWSLGNLASGAVSNVTLTVAAPASGTLTNVATVGSPTGDPVLTNNITPPVLTTIIPVADVGLGKSGPLGATFNTNFSYSITVTNFGPSTASGVLVTDTLPAGLVFVSAVPATGTNNIGQVIWSLGNFPAGTASNLTLTVLSTARGGVTNIASVGAPTLDPVLVNNTSQPVISQVTNIPPIANPDSYSISENSGTNTFAPLVNDVVLNPGGTLQLISVSTTNGTAVINGTNVLFVPGTNYVGLLTINYTITDNVGGTNSSYITVLVTNIPPIANPDFYTVGENSGTATLNPLANDSVSTPGGILSLVRVSPTNGAANISGANVLFTPALNFFGVATIGYTITDGIGGTNTSLITVIVTNVPPVANAQSVTTPENVAVQITLTGSDPNHLPLTYAIVGNPPNGTLSSLNPSTGTVTYTPGTNYAGSDSFTFRVNNGQTNSATATVSITITPVADLAVTQSGPATGFAGSNLVFTVTVTNLGPATATSLVISNALAAGYNFVSAAGGGVDTGNLVIWDLATLPAHGVTNFTVTAFAAQGGAYTNIASGASAVLDLNPTNNNGSQISATAVTMITPVADLVVYKVGGTNVFAGATVSYTITASNAGPSTATSVVVQDTLPAGGTFQSATGTYSVSNGVVTWSGLTLTPGAVTTFNITLLASANVTSFINIASGTSPVFDPNPTNNNGSNILSRVTTKVTPSADVIAAIFGPATAFLGSNIVFTVTLTNAGPSTASNVVVEDLLPPNLLFVSASNGGTNSNGTNASGTITWPPILALFAGESTNFTFTARSLLAGIYTNVVSSISTTYDPNPTNNTGVLPSAQAETQVSQPQFTITAGTPVFNPQDGLYEEQATVTNTGTVTVPGFQLFVTGLRSGVSLYNAAGTNNGTPYVQYGYPLDPGNSVHFVLEFYDPSRQAFTNGLYVVAYMPTNGTISGVSNGVPVTIFYDNRSTPPRMVLEWPSVIGTTYLVIYATTPNATSWNIATPSITATANITQWYDDGPPKTQSAPLNTSARFYRVIKY